MSTRETSGTEDPIIESRDQLVAPMQRGEKPKADWRIGTEHEKLVYCCDEHRALSYDEEGGIRDILLSLREFGWEPVEEGGKVIAMRGDDGTVSLEPAGQLELSGAPLENLTRPAPKPGGIWPRSRRSAKRPTPVSWDWACGPTRPAPSCRSCPRAAMASC